MALPALAVPALEAALAQSLDPKAMAACHLDLGQAYLSLEVLPGAVNHLERAQQIFSELPEPKGVEIVGKLLEKTKANPSAH